MWPKAYKNYPLDKPLTKNPVETGHGVIGCQMHELNGWGESYHIPRPLKKKRGLLRTFLDTLKVKKH